VQHKLWSKKTSKIRIVVELLDTQTVGMEFQTTVFVALSNHFENQKTAKRNKKKSIQQNFLMEYSCKPVHILQEIGRLIIPEQPKQKPKPRKIDAVFISLDDVILNMKQLHYEAWRNAFAKYSVELSKHDFEVLFSFEHQNALVKSLLPQSSYSEIAKQDQALLGPNAPAASTDDEIIRQFCRSKEECFRAIILNRETTHIDMIDGLSLFLHSIPQQFGNTYVVAVTDFTMYEAAAILERMQLSHAVSVLEKNFCFHLLLRRNTCCFFVTKISHQFHQFTTTYYHHSYSLTVSYRVQA